MSTVIRGTGRPGAVAGGQGRLRRGAIGALGAAVVSMAFMGPATSVFFNTAPAAARIGYALPFGIVLAMVACLLMANTIAEFSRKLPSAGFAYTFNTRAFGQRTGFTSGWLLAVAYVAVGPMLFSALGGFGSAFVHTEFTVNIPWWLISLALIALVGWIGSRGISRSVKLSVIFLVLEVVVLLGLFATIIGGGGAQGNAVGPFNPLHSLHGVSGIGYGMLWGILMFVGFESAGTLGEETRDPRRAIPFALFAAVGLIGVVFVLSGYAAAVGFGASHAGALAGDASPWTTLSNRYWGTDVAWVVSLTVLNSQFANVLAGSNAAVRMVFSLGREGVIHRSLGRTNDAGSPTRAWVFYLVLSAAATLAVGFYLGPLNAYNFFGTILGLGIVVVYLAMNAGLIVFFARRHRGEFSALRHGLLPVVASLLMLLPVYGLVWPVPAWPYNLIPYLILAWIVAGLAWFSWLSRHRPDTVAAMGRIWGERDTEAAPAAADPS